MRALFLSHESDVLPGYLGEAARRRDITVDVWDAWRGAPPPSPAGYDLLVPLGSAASAYDDTVPWLASELDLLDTAARSGVPVFGVCFGAQALARVLDGAVAPADLPEVGWYTIETTAPDLIAPGPWLEWHFDALTPPPGAEVLATSAAGVQAWRRDRVLGVQFHPEVTPGILDAWARAAPEKLCAAGVDGEALRAETRRRAGPARVAALDLFDRVLGALGVAPPR